MLIRTTFGRIRAVAAAATFLALAGLASAASAVTFEGDFTVNALDHDPGLVIKTAPLGSPLNFSLDRVGDSYTTDLFRIWTNEKSANMDDFMTADIAVDFTFTTPAGFGQVTGTTHAAKGLLTAWGELIWDGPTEISFGDGRVLTVTLSNAKFNKGIFSDFFPGYGFGADVEAIFALSAIPLPAGLPLLLSGVGGLALLRRRQKVVPA